MIKKSTVIAMAAFAAMFAIAVFASYFGVQSAPGGVIVLPPGQSASDPGSQLSDENSRMVSRVTVDRDNVKAVIAALRRPESYIMTVETQLFYEGGSHVVGSRTCVRGDLARNTVFAPDGMAQTETILTRESVYIWNAGGRSFYKGSRGDFSADDLGFMPTYELLLGLADECFEEAALRELDGDMCVYAAVRNALSGALDEYYISVNSGLLVFAQGGGDDGPAFRMSAVVSLEAIDDAEFTLPNGAVVTE